MNDEEKFGDDDGADDQYDAGGLLPDADQVAIRIHEERVDRGLVEEGTPADWEHLSDDEKAIGAMVGDTVTTRAVDGESPRAIARELDEIRDFLGADTGVGDRHNETKVIESVLDNLYREGTLI